MNGVGNREQEQKKRYKIAYNFAKLESKQGFGDTIGNGKISMDMANREQEQ